MPFTKEAADVPDRIFIKPVYDATGAIVSVPCTFAWVERIKNDSNAADMIVRETKSLTIDLLDAGKSVTVGTTATYQKVAQYLKKIADQERALIP